MQSGVRTLRNAEFPLFGKEYSREDFEKKLKENPANDHLKVVVTEKQRTEAPSEKKPDGIQFSIGFSEHPAFYDRQLNDRYTDLSFALGNKLIGALEEKQHRERASKEIDWYHKTDFEITAIVGGEDFHYEGRFDIGDGEGDLIAHIKNYYDYCLSPQCPFIPEWKRQGEDYYRERMESLRLGRDVFIPFLEQNTELTPEDEKLLSETMATESDWYRKAEEPERPSAADEMIAYAEKVASEYESEPKEERLEILMTSDAFPDPEDVYATLNTHYCLNLCGKAKHKVELGSDALGNLTRIENELAKIPVKLEVAKTKLTETIEQLQTAKAEVEKPFAFEDELREKTERLNALNIELNLSEKDRSVMDTEPDQSEEQPERKCANRER